MHTDALPDRDAGKRRIRAIVRWNRLCTHNCVAESRSIHPFEQRERLISAIIPIRRLQRLTMALVRSTSFVCLLEVLQAKTKLGNPFPQFRNFRPCINQFFMKLLRVRFAVGT